MSQSAENQSAIIENENNFNIDMESQAAMSSQEETAGEGGGEAFAEQEPAQQPGGEESMEVADDGGDGGEEQAPEPELIGDGGDASDLPAEGFAEESSRGMGAGGDAFQEGAAEEEAPVQSPGDNQQEAPEAMDIEGEPEVEEDVQEPEREAQEADEEPVEEPAQEPVQEELQEEADAGAEQDWGESADAGREEEGEAGVAEGGQQEDLEPPVADEASQDEEAGPEAEQQLEDTSLQQEAEQDTSLQQEAEQDAGMQQEGEQDDQVLGQGEGAGEVAMSAEDEDRLLAEESQDAPAHAVDDQASQDAPPEVVDDQASQDAAEFRQEEDGIEEGQEQQQVPEEEEPQLVDESSQDKPEAEGMQDAEEFAVGENDVSQDIPAGEESHMSETLGEESQGGFSAAGDESNAAADESNAAADESNAAADESNVTADLSQADDSQAGLDESSQPPAEEGAAPSEDQTEGQAAGEGEEVGEKEEGGEDQDVSMTEGEKAAGEEAEAGDANTSEDTIEEDHGEVMEVRDDDDEEPNREVAEPAEPEPETDDAIIAKLVSEVTKKVAAEVDGVTEDEKPPAVDDDDDDVVVLDEEPALRQVKKEVIDNDMGIQIASVSGGADHVHQQAIKQENGVDVKPDLSSVKSEPKSTPPSKKSSKGPQTCIVCQKIGKCKYNIVRNGDIKHLCDDNCFKQFRANPSMFLKGKAAQAPAADKAKAAAPKPLSSAGVAPPSTVYKTCVVCQLMNINTQGSFCMWKGLDFCGEGCLGKFQTGISTSCTLCTSFIPLTGRSSNCLRVGSEVRPFCSSRCYNDYKMRMRLCTFCQKDLSTTSDSFSAPVGSDSSFKDFCSQTCMKKYEDLLSTDVEILRVEPGKQQSVNPCSVCQKSEVAKHTVKYNNVVHHLCSDPCLSAFQYTNKLDMSACDDCGSLCTQLEASAHTVQFEGSQKRFCSDACVTKFRLNHRKVSPCSWCGSARDNFDMIERLDASNKYQLFCSLNCLSLYRVNLQAKSNQSVTCDQCMKFVPAQYHLTMSDASVRNFCCYSCVMTFQSQFSKPQPPAPSGQTPRHKHNTRGKGRPPSVSAGSPSFPIISNVVSLAPQGGQKVNIKNTTGAPVVVSGAGQTVKTTGVQQQIIIQPPPPKQVKNKSLLCKPFTQTKATSCRPHTQTKECQTDEVKEKPVLIPVPIPIYLPTPCALYTAPAPTPVFIPVPIPVPIFIPTTRKSANGILKQIKEIRERTPADPLEAEILMMAAAVSADGKNSSDSDTEEEMLPVVSRGRKRDYEDDDDANVMPLTTGNEDREEDMISMALRMAEEMSGPISDLESAVEAMPVNTDPPPQAPRQPSPDISQHEAEMAMMRRSSSRSSSTSKRGSSGNRRGSSAGRPPKRPRVQTPQHEPISMRQEPPPPPAPPADANYHLKFTYGVNAWRHWVVFKNTQIERNSKPGDNRVRLFKTDIMQCTPDELNFSLCLFVKEVRKPNGEEYSPDSIYYLTLGIQQYLFENGRIDNIFADIYYERFTDVLTEILVKCQPKFNSSGQMVCRIEEEHLWECKQLGAHSPYVLLNTLIYFHTKYFMLKTPEDHMKLSFAHILKYWKKGGPGKGGQPTRSVSLRYYSVSTAKKDGSAPTSTTKKGSKEGIPVYEVTENQDNPLRCPVKLYEFYLSKCPESIKNRSDIFYPVPERSCVPDSPVWYSTSPINADALTKMLTRILLVREIQEAHLHAQPIYV